MALEFSFFNAKNIGGVYDRTYTAEDVTNYLKDIVGSGIFPNPSTCLQVRAGTGMTVYVSPGEGWIEGFRLKNTTDYALTIDAADVTLNRIDRIVFRVNKTERVMEIVVKKGTIASSPNPPTIVRNEDIIEYGLATITVNKRTTTITNSMIRDTRLDSSVCGVVQGLIQQVSTETLYQQWSDAFDQQYDQAWDEFNSWFQYVKDTISSATLVREYRQNITTAGTNTTKVNVQIAQFTLGVDILNVYVNGVRLRDDEFKATQTEITFTKPIDKTGTPIEIVVYKSIDGEGAETIVETVEAMRNSLRQPTELYSGTHTPETTGAIKYLSIPTLSQYDIIIVQATIGTIGEQMLYFYKGTASNGKLNQTFSIYKDANTYGTATVQYDNVANQIGLRSEAIKTWTVSQITIKKVWGIKL